jgi:anti-sigma factor RsiW
MSRDRGDASDGARGGDELLTAYVDGVSELSPADRKRIEAQLAGAPQARADEAQLRALLGRLRALPPEGDEPDWAAMERSIHAAVGDEVPRPWWRAWRWLVPLTSFATAAAVLILLASRPSPSRAPSAPVASVDVGTPATPDRADRGAPADRAEPAGDRPVIVPLWLDGVEVDVDLSAAEILRGPDAGEYDPAQPGADDDDGALLPSTGLSWVDHLDDDALSRAERWLASAPAAPAGAGRGAMPRKKS